MSGFSGFDGGFGRLRILLISAVVILSVLVYSGHLFSLQVVDGYVYSLRAEHIKRRSSAIPAQRGQIYDRHYDVPLVANVDSFALVVTPGEIPPGKHQETLERIAETLSVDLDTLTEKVPRELYGSFREIEVVSGLAFSQLAYLAERSDRLPGVHWYSKPIRNYTQGAATAHVLGYVGDITPEELQVLFNQGYTAHSVVGKSGIERQYDMILQGRPGRRFRTVDAAGRRMSEETEEVPPVLGDNIVLTLDRKIQHLAVDALGERSGSVVVMKPSTGEILAMASYPHFDPNRFYGRGGAEAFREVSLSPNSPFLNRSIQSSYPPASTWKILMTTAVVEEGVFSLNETVNANGTYRLGNRVFNDWRPQGFGPLNLYEGLAMSSNVFFWTMGVEYLGAQTITDYALRFGFGAATGVDLPGEVPGLVPTPAWKQQTFNSPWVGGDTANLSIGQGFLAVTPLQLANMVALTVNDGVVYVPHVLREVRDQVTGEVIRRATPEVLFQMAASPETFQHVRQAMRGVITDGTAEVVITTPAVEAAGKTGTGEVGSDETWHSWFVAYAPYEVSNPDERVVVVVLVDAANEWEWWAPKAANIILHGIFTDQDFEGTVRSLRRGPRPLWYM